MDNTKSKGQFPVLRCPEHGAIIRISNGRCAQIKQRGGLCRRDLERVEVALVGEMEEKLEALNLLVEVRAHARQGRPFDLIRLDDFLAAHGRSDG